MNYDSRLRRQPFEQGSEAFRLEGDASRRRSKSRPGKVDEYGAAAAGDTRPRVVVDLHDEIIEMVLPPQPVAGRSLDEPNRPVVAPVGRVLAPGVRRLILRTGRPVRGRGPRSARHHTRSGRKRPRGVAPSPSTLFALTPQRPSATCRRSGPATSHPRLRSPAPAVTVTRGRVLRRRRAPIASIEVVFGRR